ncbi:MAG TPA: alpha/beta fold hydrolase, partial [Acidimicrobiales bacterium]
MPHVAANGIELFYEVIGDEDGPPLLLIMGLGTQLLGWDDDLCAGFADRGFRVIRFDNRDIGLSTHLATPGLDVLGLLFSAIGGAAVEAPYLLADMAADAVGLLDALGIDAAHVVGASMGGMIAQTIAIEHPERVLSLTSIMSTTGEPDVGGPDPEILPILMPPPPVDRAEAIEQRVATSRAISSPDHFDEDHARDYATRAYDRDTDPMGTPRQLLAIAASGSRAEGLAALHVPTLVIHGRQDRLVSFTGGERTAALVPGAQFLAIDDMAHDLPPA